MNNSSLERVTVKLPEGFDPDKHGSALTAMVTKKRGAGFELQNIDRAAGTATFVRGGSIASVQQSDSKRFRVNLPRSTKATEAAKIAARYEDERPGFYMTEFDPFLLRATFTQMNEDTVRARGALANALSVKPWEVIITPRRGGGYDLELPKSYMGSKHDDKLLEVTTSVIGADGWRFLPNRQKLTAQILPGEPPVFPPAVKYPLDELSSTNVDVFRVGYGLPEAGEGIGDAMVVDWTQNAWCLLFGLPGSGKTVTINSLIAQALAAGCELVICDDAEKSVDFLWCKDFVRPGGWGCDSKEAAVASLSLAYEEGKRRSSILKERGVVNYAHLPESERFKPIFIVVDEVSALLVQDPIPKGVPKDNPIVTEINESNYASAMIGRMMNKIVAEQRFVGARMVASTQVGNRDTGMPPSMKNKFGHVMLQGLSPSRAARTQSFADESIVPTVPEAVRNSGNGARGVGVAAFTGSAPAVYKSMFEDVKAYRAALLELGVPTTSQPAPTPEQIAQYMPSLDGDDDAPAGERTPSGKPLDPRFGPVETFDADGNKLFGAAAAAKASKSAKDSTLETNLPMCPACTRPIQPDGSCACTH